MSGRVGSPGLRDAGVPWREGLGALWGGAPSPRSAPGDVVRTLALVSVLVGAWLWGLVGFALFWLVLGGAMVARALRAPAALDTSYSLVLVGAAWAAQLDWYRTVPGLDLAVHAVATGLIAAMAHLAWRRAGAAAPAGWSAGALVATAGAALAVVWELLEWAGHLWLDPRIQVGVVDSASDLAAGVVGACVAAVLVTSDWRSPRDRG